MRAALFLLIRLGNSEADLMAGAAPAWGHSDPNTAKQIQAIDEKARAAQWRIIECTIKSMDAGRHAKPSESADDGSSLKEGCAPCPSERCQSEVQAEYGEEPPSEQHYAGPPVEGADADTSAEPDGQRHAMSRATSKVYKCSQCLWTVARGELSKWLRANPICIPFAIPARVRDESVGAEAAPRPLPGIRFGAGHIHGSHKVTIVGGIAYCLRCGYYAWQRPTRLAETCLGRLSPKGAQVLSRMRRGLLPCAVEARERRAVQARPTLEVYREGRTSVHISLA